MEDPISKNLFSAFEGEENKGNSNDPAKVHPKKEPMKVVLRVKPFTQKDKNAKEDQGCIVLKENGKVEFCAPQDSFQFKSSIRGLAEQTHEFSFSRVFDDKTKQKKLFDEIMLPFVKDILDGQNGLVFTYGVTNSGKTYTIQGTPKDGGILPRALDVIFNSISKNLYNRPNLKPKHCHDVIALSPDEEAQEDLIRKSIFHACDKENIDLSVFKTLNSTTKSDASTTSGNSTLLSNISMISASKGPMTLDDGDISEEIKSRVADVTSLCVEQQGNVRFGVWVSFMEIYNELIYDLLDLTLIGKGRKRIALKLGEDKNGKPYVKGLREIFVTSSDEAYKVLRLGQKNRHIASTKLNQQSSRSHCIFNIKLLKVVDVGQPHVARISRLSIVDLAGSERYCRTGAEGDLLRQAGNINASIMTLGKCISTLRYNQEHPNHQTIIPFRESKLTRLFQSFFLGKGKASMIVNISQCASVFDETLHVLKFSAVAKQIKMKAERATEFWREPPLPKVPATPSTSKRPPLTMVTPATSKKRTLDKPTEFSYDELVNIVGELRDKVKKERMEKSNIETTIRREVSQEMNELIVEIESSHNTELMEQKHNLEDLMEKRLELLTKTVNKRKRKKMDDSSGDDTQTSFALFEAEKLKVKERDDLILTLTAKVREIEAEQDFFNKKSPEDRSNKIEILTNDIREAKQTLALQNEGMERMQQMLQEKDDEIDKLREALDDDVTNPESNDLVKELQNLLEATTKELDNARVKLDNRDIRIKELENTTSCQKADNEELTKICSKQEEWIKIEKERNAQLSINDSEWKVQIEKHEEGIKKLDKELIEATQKLTESQELCKTLQFENDEFSFKIEKYETSMKDHQTVLSDNENFIEQLNKEVVDLKIKLKQFEDNKQHVAATEVDIAVKEEQKDKQAKIKMDLETAERKLHESNQKIERLEKQNQCFEAVAVDKTPVRKLKQKAGLVNTPDNLASPFNKFSTTPRTPYSPATKASSQQIVKKLEKILDEKTKELEKKNSIVVQKTNRVQHLEQQLSALEKKTSIKELRVEKETLESNVELLSKELIESQQVLQELKFKLSNQEGNSAALETEVAGLTQKYESVDTELTNLKQEYEIHQRKFEEDEKHQNFLLKQANDDCSKACSKNDELSLKITEMEDQNTALTRDLENLKKAEETFKCNIIELEKSLEATKKNLATTKILLDDSNQQLEVIKRDKERTAESSKKLAKQLDDRRKSRMYVDDRFTSTVDGYEARIKSLHEEIDDLNQEKELMENQVSELQQKTNEEKKASEEISILKKSEAELQNKIELLEEKVNKFERDSQLLTTIKVKLDMKIKTLENEVLQQKNKLAFHETERMEFKEQAKSFSERLNMKNKEVLDLIQEKDKVQRENDNYSKKIDGLEKQKAETEAIISSLQENENKTAESKEEIKSLNKKNSELQHDMAGKDKEILKLKTESQILEENVSDLENVKKKNIELKESLALNEKELKRTTEEKKYALDELLKQTVKPKRKLLLSSKDSCLEPDCSALPSDKEDEDYKTPAKKSKKKCNSIPRTRFTRSAKKVIPEEVTLASQDEAMCYDKTEGKQNESKLDDDYAYTVSIALSPVVFIEQLENQKQTETITEVTSKQNKIIDRKDVGTATPRRSARKKK